jgi:polysaccharide biosynthesis protein PslH
MGLLNYSPNEKGLLRFIRNILPAIEARYPDTTLLVIGANPTAEIRRAAAQHQKRITLAGFVDDYRAMICKTEVFVAPIYAGSGINVKIIDALALGMPIVTTPIGIEGLPIADGVNIMIAKTDEEFAEDVIRLLADSRLRQRLSVEAYQYIATHNDYQSIRNQFLRVLDLSEQERNS